MTQAEAAALRTKARKAGDDGSQGAAAAVQAWVAKGLSLAEALYQVLRSEIVTGVIDSGERLRERELSDRYGASRTPVREALHRLDSEGLLTTDGRGMTVVQMSMSEIMDGYVLREALLCIVVRLAIERAEDADIDELTAVLAQLGTEIGGGNLSEGLRLCLVFDEHLYRATHSQTILRSFDVSLGPPGAGARALNDLHRLTLAFGEREAILDAIRARDVERAMRAAREHCRNGRKRSYEVLIDVVTAP